MHPTGMHSCLELKFVSHAMVFVKTEVLLKFSL